MPKFLLLENVPALQAYRHKDNFKDWQNVLEELGYYNKIYQLNAFDFGLPQNRERLLMVSVLINGDQELKAQLDKYFHKHDLANADYRNKQLYTRLKLNQVLKIDYSNPNYYKEALECQPNNTASRREIWETNPRLTDDDGNIIAEKVATLTTKQDRNPNSGNLKLNFNNGKSEYRYLTPRECFILMGFEENDYENLMNNNVHIKSNGMLFTRDKIIRLAGNSIAVNVLQAIFKQIMYIRKNILKIK